MHRFKHTRHKGFPADLGLALAFQMQGETALARRRLLKPTDLANENPEKTPKEVMPKKIVTSRTKTDVTCQNILHANQPSIQTY